MSVDAPRRTFPKKASSFNLKKNVYKNKMRETIVGGTVLTRKPQRYFVADLSENDGLASKKRKKKTANGLKKAKNGKPAKIVSNKKKKLHRGEAVKGTSIDHKMLGGLEDEMYASEDDIVDITDMLEDEDDTTTVPMAHAVKRSTLLTAEKTDQGNEVSDEEEVFEFSTGRGSSKLDLSSDTDDDEEAGPSRKDVELDNEEYSSELGDKVKARNGMVHKSSDMRKIVETGEADDFGNDMQGEEEEKQEADDQEDEGEEDEEEAIANFRADLADLPLGKVREMKEKLGLKLFNKAYFGATEAAKKAEESRKKKLEAKKVEFHGQHRPKEISSKKPVSVFRPIYQENGKKKRDPRFDNRAGLFKERCFDDNYHFLEDLKRQEKEELTKEAVACEERGDTETAGRIRETLRRMENRERTKAERKMKEETLRELREANIERMMHGERPVFKTKAQVKMMNLEKKFKQLKKDNKLDKYMKRKAKKEAHKDMKKKPSFEEMYGYH